MTYMMSYNSGSLEFTPVCQCADRYGVHGLPRSSLLSSKVCSEDVLVASYIGGSNVHLVGIIGQQRSSIVASPPVP